MIKALASGRIVDVDEATGLVTFETCPWHVSVPSRNPEPDSLADCWIEISCDEPLFADPGFEVVETAAIARARVRLGAAGPAGRGRLRRPPSVGGAYGQLAYSTTLLWRCRSGRE